MARRKHTKRPPVPSRARILELLLRDFYALIGLQAASGKNTEEKFSKIDRKKRKKVKTKLERKFAGLRTDQKKRARSKKTR